MRILIDRDAAKALAKMPADQAQRIRERIKAYAADPSSPQHDARKLKSRREYRLRVGDWRVLFELGDDTMTVTDIGPRGDIYKK